MLFYELIFVYSYESTAPVNYSYRFTVVYYTSYIHSIPLSFFKRWKLLKVSLALKQTIVNRSDIWRQFGRYCMIKIKFYNNYDI